MKGIPVSKGLSVLFLLLSQPSPIQSLKDKETDAAPLAVEKQSHCAVVEEFHTAF